VRYVGGDPDLVREFGPIVEMRGIFRRSVLIDRTHRHTFTPTGKGEGRAVVMPIFEDNEMVDMLAVSKHDGSCWGMVTGLGSFVGRITPEAPVRVFFDARRWFAWDCCGVLALDKSHMVRLQKAPQLIAETVDHACDLAEQVRMNPAFYDGIGSVDDAETHAADRILIDETDAEIELEMRGAA
jgi:hypothetical protein